MNSIESFSNLAGETGANFSTSPDQTVDYTPPWFAFIVGFSAGRFLTDGVRDKRFHIQLLAAATLTIGALNIDPPLAIVPMAYGAGLSMGAVSHEVQR